MKSYFRIRTAKWLADVYGLFHSYGSKCRWGTFEKKAKKLENWKLLSVTNSKYTLFYKHLSFWLMIYDSYFVILSPRKTEGFQHLLYNLIAICVPAMARDKLVFQKKKPKEVLQCLLIFLRGPTNL